MHDSTSDSQWCEMGRNRFVALTTFRRSGVGVTTPVWIAPDGDRLVVTSEARVGKVKRLRNSSRVRLQPCSRLDRIEAGARAIDAHGQVLGSNDDHPIAVAALRRKYGLQFTLVLTLERTVRRVQRKNGDRVIIAIRRPEA